MTPMTAKCDASEYRGMATNPTGSDKNRDNGTHYAAVERAR